MPGPEEDDDDDKICRVCRDGPSDAHPLFHPCLCKGSLRWVHEDCLQSWLAHSGKTHCELCGRDFQFARVYDPSMPPSMGPAEFVSGLIKVVRAEVLSWGRVVVVAFCWGVVFPVVARWTWQLYFGEWVLPWEREDPLARLGWDCLQGLCIGGVVFCAAMGAFGLRDFMVANGIPLQDPLEFFELQLANEGAVDAGGAVDAAAVGNNNAAAAANADAAAANFDDLPALIGPGGNVVFPAGAADAVERGEAPAQPPDAGDAELVAAERELNAQLQAVYAPLIAAADAAADAAAARVAAAQGGAAAMEAAAAAMAAASGNAVDTDTDSDEECDHAGEGVDVALESEGSDDDDDDDSDSSSVADSSQGGYDDDDGDDGIDIDGLDGDEWEEGEGDWGADDMPLEELVGLVGPLHQLVDNLLWIVLINAAVVFAFAKLPAVLGEFVVWWAGGDVESVWLHMLVGWACVTVYAIAHLSLPAAWVPWRARVDNDSVAARCFTFGCVFVKVCALLACEILLCPLLCGWWLDICSLEVQQSSLRSRVALFHYAPWTSTFLHWFVGMLFMHNFASFVSLCRSVLHPRAVWFFRDPDNPDFHPLKQMLELPLPRYARRLVAISIMYGLLVVLLVWLPVKTLCRAWPGFMPYRYLVSHPLEMLLFTFGLPLAQGYGELGDAFADGVRWWFQTVSRRLGLAEYMLPPGDDGDGDGERPWGPLEGEQRRPASHADDPYEQPTMMRARVATLMLLGWLTAYALITYAISVPVWMGRVVLASSAPGGSGHSVHDFYAWAVGVGLHGAAVAVADVDVRGALGALERALRGHGRHSAVARRVVSVCRLAVFVAVAVVLFPLAVGVLLDLMLVTPLTCPLAMTPATTLWQDWGLGIMFCKALYDLDVHGVPPLEWFCARVHGHVEGFDAARGVGLYASTTLDLFVPPLALVGLSLSVPYVVGYSALFRDMWGAAKAVETCRLLFPLAASCVTVRVARNRLLAATESLYQAIVDENYLIGRRLINVDGGSDDESDDAAERAGGGVEPRAAVPVEG